MKKCVKDLIAGAVLALCSIGYYIASHSIQSFGSNKDFISARTIPVGAFRCTDGPQLCGDQASQGYR